MRRFDLVSVGNLDGEIVKGTMIRIGTSDKGKKVEGHVSRFHEKTDGTIFVYASTKDDEREFHVATILPTLIVKMYVHEDIPVRVGKLEKGQIIHAKITWHGAEVTGVFRVVDYLEGTGFYRVTTSKANDEYTIKPEDITKVPYTGLYHEITANYGLL